jgi:hypothetical protein
MKPLIGNAAANSPTCHVREADANLLNLFPQSSQYLLANCSNPGSIASLFLFRARLYGLRNNGFLFTKHVPPFIYGAAQLFWRSAVPISRS